MTHCPRCHSLQAFSAKKRQSAGLSEIYIACSKCRWERVLYKGSEIQVKIKQDIDTLKGKVLRGDPLQRVLDSRRKRLRP